MRGHVHDCTAEVCSACRGELPVLGPDDLAPLRRRLDGDWRVVDGRRLERDFLFADFRAALAFANGIGEIAERLAHHPEIQVSWGKVRVTVWTYAVNGLTETDFDLAESVERLAVRARPNNGRDA